MQGSDQIDLNPSGSNENGRAPKDPPANSASFRLRAYAVSDCGSIFTPGPMVELSEIFFT